MHDDVIIIDYECYCLLNYLNTGYPGLKGVARKKVQARTRTHVTHSL